MSWKAEWSRELDLRGLREDLGTARRRGRVPVRTRLTWWAGIGVVSVLTGAPEAAAPSLLLFEALLAPGLARRPRRPMDSLSEWRPPESWRPSPEAPARGTGRP